MQRASVSAFQLFSFPPASAAEILRGELNLKNWRWAEIWKSGFLQRHFRQPGELKGVKGVKGVVARRLGHAAFLPPTQARIPGFQRTAP